MIQSKLKISHIAESVSLPLEGFLVSKMAIQGLFKAISSTFVQIYQILIVARPHLGHLYVPIEIDL